MKVTWIDAALAVLVVASVVAVGYLAVHGGLFETVFQGGVTAFILYEWLVPG